MHSIAIIGGGFSGSLTAINVARFSEIPLKVTIINCGFPTGRGIAYSTRRPEHWLNVAARNMSALGDLPNHFVDWLRTRTEYAELPESVLRETFVPRRVYGDYLRSLLQWYVGRMDARCNVQIEIRDDQATDVIPADGKAKVILASGESIEAEKVVLATGHQPPAAFGSVDSSFHHPHYCENPWEDWERMLPEKHENVVLLGTGLTTIDAFLTLRALDWRGTIFAVSRNGLLPQSHFRGIEYPDFPPKDPSTLRLPELVAMIEEHCGRLRLLGANPAIAVDKLRPHTQRIWQNWTSEERREFIQRYAARWNVTRHRIAAEIFQQVTDALAEGKLRVVTARIDGLHAMGSKIGVTVEGAGGTRIVLEAGMVINGTGPQMAFTACKSPLYQNLLAAKRIQADELDMGILVDSDFSVLEGSGQRSPWLFALGPLLRGSLWETIAVPELRNQTLRLAQIMLEQLGVDEQQRIRWPVASEIDLIEYCI